MDKYFFLFADTELFAIVCRTGSATITTGGAALVVPDLLFSKLIVESNHSFTFCFADTLSIEEAMEIEGNLFSILDGCGAFGICPAPCG